MNNRIRYCLGIDLGTTFSVMAVVDETGKPVVIQNKEGQATTPSVIYFGDEETIVGDEAKDYQSFGAAGIAAFFKRSMGDKHYQLDFNGKLYDTIQLSALVLKKMKKDAEDQLGQSITDAVITVPAYFNNNQRQATIQAGEMAGFNVLRIINEPTAAAIAYGMKGAGPKKVMVYDLGGGTFDVTIASISETSIDVIATDGDHALGGKDWDDCLTMYVSEKFQEEFGLDPLEDDDAFNSILVSCEKAKKLLSSRGRSMVKVVYGGKNGNYEVTQTLFEELTSHLLERTGSLSTYAVQQAGLQWHDLDEVILVGGSTRMPMVSQLIERLHGQKPKIGINVDEVVALGAAIQARMEVEKLSNVDPIFSLGSPKKIQDVMSHSLGMVAVNQDRSRYINSIIIKNNKPIPSLEKRPYQIQTNPYGDNILEIYILQGESERPLDCEILGKYVVSNITHVQKGQAVIDVSYSYDVNGVVNVTAIEKSTGNQLPITVEELPDDLSWLDGSPDTFEVIYQKMAVVIAIDLSGSMAGNPLKQAQKAAGRFVDEMNMEHTSVGLIGFADRSKVSLEVTQNYKEIINGIERFQSIYKENKLGYGNRGEPFTDSFNLLSKHEGPRFLIVLTDGVWANTKQAISAAKRCHDQGIEVIAIGFGAANKRFLQQIATADEHALTTDLSSLVSSFSRIAQVLTDTSNQNKQRKLQFFI